MGRTLPVVDRTGTGAEAGRVTVKLSRVEALAVVAVEGDVRVMLGGDETLGEFTAVNIEVGSVVVVG